MANILIINQYATTLDFGFGGRSFYFARELQKLGHKVTLAAASFHHLQHKQPKTKGFITKLLSNDISMLFIKTFSYKHAHDKKRILNWFIFMLGIALLRPRLQSKPDIIIYSSPSLVGYLGALYLARRTKAKLIFDVRDIWPLSIIELGGYSTSHPFVRLLSYIEKLAYRESDLITSSMNGFQSYLKEINEKVDHYLWLPNGIDLGAFNKLNTNTNIQLPIANKKNKFIVGYLGTIGVANAIDNLIEAATLLQKDETIQFVLVGGGKEKTELSKLAEQRRLKNIVFMDAVPKNQVTSIIKQFDLCYAGVHDNKIYQYGISLQKIPEYMICGKPVLCAYSGQSDPLFNSQGGKIVKADNPVLLVQAIKDFQQIPIERLELMGKKGCAFVKKELSYQQIAVKLHTNIQKLLQLN